MTNVGLASRWENLPCSSDRCTCSATTTSKCLEQIMSKDEDRAIVEMWPPFKQMDNFTRLGADTLSGLVDHTRAYMERRGRPNKKHAMFMGMAAQASLVSTCYRRSVGAIITGKRDGFTNAVLSIGYNGPPSGDPHCTGNDCAPGGVCTRALHAEANAITHVAPHDMKLTKTLYTTESPCMACAALIAEREIDIRRVFFMHEYRVRDGIEFLWRRNIAVFRITPSGYIVNTSNNELVELLA